MVILNKVSSRLERFAGQLARAARLAKQWADLHKEPAVCVFLVEWQGVQRFAYDAPDRVPEGAWIVECWIKRGCVWQNRDFFEILAKVRKLRLSGGR
ncbi:MAG: hypothetical protein KatS3mg109_0765 [Pirellulaceae bacterium]|nr:MAG: hypothetical protein KatS3mg109_0765 [Pirellulaceae bacterium]